MTRLKYFSFLFCYICAAGSLSVSQTVRESDSDALPNLVIILADDLGYGDLGCYGHPVHRTPNLDNLAASGAMFKSYYVTSPVCTPTRYALLTGRHPARERMFGVIWPPSKHGMKPGEVTIAEWLSAAGYVTGLSGKWHLGHAEPAMLPTAQGFDSWYGMPYPNDMDPDHSQTQFQKGHWPEMPMYRGDAIVEQPIDVNLLTQQYTAEAVRFIAENHHRPFFLFVSHAMPHTHLGASPDFMGRSANGLYGDAVEELDWSVGEIIRILRAFELEENTLVVFTSDNGAVFKEAESLVSGAGSNGVLRSGKGWVYEGGIRVPAVFSWPGYIPAGLEIIEPAVITDMVATFADLAGLPSMPTAIDSYSIAHLLRGGGADEDRPIFFGSGDIRAVRLGKWKLSLYDEPAWKQNLSPTPMMFNLETDPAEQRNVINDYPEIADTLLQMIQVYQGEVDTGSSN